MKQVEEDDEMLEEYDFSNAIRNPYVQRFRELHLVSLDADVSRAFPTSEAVNEALRLLMKTARALPQAS